MSDTALSAPAFAQLLRAELGGLPGVVRHTHCRRFTALFTAGIEADRLYFLESGLIKLFQRGDDGKEIVLHIVVPGELFGERAALPGAMQELHAEVMETGTVWSVPRDSFLHWVGSRAEIAALFTQFLLHRQRTLERKVELLCLRDVEQRILITLADLAVALNHDGGSPYSIPLSQSELASFVGATRETTSTTLNALERRGLLQLGRRMLMVSSLEALREAAHETSVRGTVATAEAVSA